jgi:RNA polymerase-binding protein DksA
VAKAVTKSAQRAKPTSKTSAPASKTPKKATSPTAKATPAKAPKKAAAPKKTAKKVTKKAPTKPAPKVPKKPAAKAIASKGIASKGTHAGTTRPAKKKATSRREAKAPTVPATTTVKKTATKKPAPAKKAAAKPRVRKKTPPAPLSTVTVKPNAEGVDEGEAPKRFQSASTFDFDFGPKIDNTEKPAETEEARVVRRRANISAKDLDKFRLALLDKRRELVGDMSSMEKEALRGEDTNLSHLADDADVGTDNYEQEFTLNLMQQEQELLNEIDRALQKIDAADGSYGICEGTGNPIGKERLDAQPWARFSIEHARDLERGKSPILQTEA